MKAGKACKNRANEAQPRSNPQNYFYSKFVLIGFISVNPWIHFLFANLSSC